MRTGAPETGFETSIGVKVDTARGRVRVTGALIGGSHGRVIRIDDYHVDVIPDGWMLVIRNRDVPGVIGRVGSALGSAGINIASYHQARRSSQSADGGPADALAAINGCRMCSTSGSPTSETSPPPAVAVPRPPTIGMTSPRR
jgi:hypothetical protein